MEDRKKISIITINYNDVEGLKRTYKSVKDQSFKDYEFIMIDGGSTDGSKEFIEEIQGDLSYWVSEPDNGVFHAMNKGIKASAGKYLYFLNSGDELFASDVLETVSSQFTDDVRIYYGDVQRIYTDGTTRIKKYPDELSFEFFYDSAIAHQTSFVERTVFEEVFYFNEDYKLFGDWAFFTCAICWYNISYKHLGIVVAKYDMDGISSQPENQKKYRFERVEIYEKYFPLIYKDYEKMVGRRSFRHDLFHQLNSNKRTRKMVYFCMRIINKLFYKKS